jgi:hypothetical protein
VPFSPSVRRWRCAQAGCCGSQVRASRHAHHVCAAIDAVPRYGACCSRAPTGRWAYSERSGAPGTALLGEDQQSFVGFLRQLEQLTHELSPLLSISPPSCRVTVVVLQQSPQPLSAPDRGLSRCPVAWQRDQHDILHALMGALLMIVRVILCGRMLRPAYRPITRLGSQRAISGNMSRSAMHIAMPTINGSTPIHKSIMVPTCRPASSETDLRMP